MTRGAGHYRYRENGTAMSENIVQQDERKFCIGVLLVALLATVLFGILCAVYARSGKAMLSQLDMSVGEVLMKKADNFRTGGALEQAKETYRQALDAQFAGPQNRAYTLKTLGGLLWEEGALEEAEQYLLEAADSPMAPITVFAPLCDVLERLKREEAFLHYVAAWRVAAQKAQRPDQEAEALYFQGRHALHKGEQQQALALFTEGVEIVPGGRNARALFDLHFRQENYAAALRYIEEYLEHETTANGEHYARQLRATILRRMK